MPTPYAYIRKQFVPLADAKVGVMTHAFNYGTGCFEGIRGNWNEAHEKIFLFRLRDHFTRLFKSSRILKIAVDGNEDDLSDIAVKLVGMCGYTEDIYLRVIAYKCSEVIGVRMHNLEDDLLMYVAPFGPYLDVEKGIRCMTSSWVRVDDMAIPARAKVTGLYVNSALAKTEAQENGFDEAILLNRDGHVSEGSGENIFLVMNGALVTPPPSDNILVGITRDTVIRLARDELGIETIERPIDRSELYVADECFMTGTAAHVTAVVDIDRRPIGNGQTGDVTHRLQKLYFEVIRGENAKYAAWCTPV
ncbi:MAG: branched-chain amino acid transaminase [Dehalococcoidia bacterium]|nr:branched-chain amino acid transaminase [Dehalococcoidia bacterium]